MYQKYVHHPIFKKGCRKSFKFESKIFSYLLLSLSINAINLENSNIGSTWIFTLSFSTPIFNNPSVLIWSFFFIVASVIEMLSNWSWIAWPIFSASSQLIPSPSVAINPVAILLSSGSLSSNGLWFYIHNSMFSKSSLSRFFGLRLILCVGCLSYDGFQRVVSLHHKLGYIRA